MKSVFTFKAIEFLRDMLAAPGWGKHDNAATAVKRLYLAGKILAEKLPEVPQVADDVLPNRNSAQFEIRAWEKAVKERNETKAPEVEFDDKMVEVIQVCLKHHMGMGQTPSGVALNELIDAFKLID